MMKVKFKPFKPFNRCAPFKPPPVSSPATRGRTQEGQASPYTSRTGGNSTPGGTRGVAFEPFGTEATGVNGLNGLNCWNGLNR